MEPVELPEIARRFAEEYVVDFKVNRAAERAGTTTAHGNELLRDPRVKALIIEAKRRVVETINVSASMVIETLRVIASIEALDARALVSINPEVNGGLPYLDVEKMTPEQRIAVKGFKWTKEGPQIEFYSKMEATKLLGEYYALFKQGLEISGPGGVPVAITSDMDPKAAAEAYREMVEGKK